MSIRLAVLAAFLIGCASAAYAESGTPEQRNACRPDVRRFCYKLKESDGDNAFLECLQAHRAKLSVACRTMLESNGV